ncbi:MAG: TetR/AcrR family transcriptional regulator [Pseudomonadota bacterium]
MADGGEIRRGRKFDQVIEGAREVFHAKGFEGASVDEIARVAGVSKATLYSYCPDKRLLFLEVARAEYERQAATAKQWLNSDGPIEDWLRTAARVIVESILSDFSRDLYRMAVSEADRFPEVAQGFYENGPMLVHRLAEPYLRKAIERGELKIDDMDLAIGQFHELCKAHHCIRFTLGLQHSFTAQEKQRLADEAVAMFLARYGTT